MIECITVMLVGWMGGWVDELLFIVIKLGISIY
jgi:hypothetical protein